MRVEAIMLPFAKLNCISVDDTLEQAIQVINEKELLSLPVVDGKEFIGVLSKQYVFEEFFNSDSSKEEFMQKKVQEFVEDKIDAMPKDMRIEEAAVRFISSKARFIPVTNEYNQLLGIVTQQAVFKRYQRMFGEASNSLVIYNHERRGTLAKLADTISKAGGNISNLLMTPKNVMDLVELFIRVDADDFDKVVKALKKQGFDVRDVIYAQETENDTR